MFTPKYTVLPGHFSLNFNQNWELIFLALAKKNSATLYSMDWYKGTLARKHHIWWEKHWFPVDFPTIPETNSLICVVSQQMPQCLSLHGQYRWHRRRRRCGFWRLAADFLRELARLQPMELSAIEFFNELASLLPWSMVSSLLSWWSIGTIQHDNDHDHDHHHHHDHVWCYYCCFCYLLPWLYFYIYHYYHYS